MIPRNTILFFVQAYEGEEVFEGRAVRHGCCKSLRELWRETRALVRAETNPTATHLFFVPSTFWQCGNSLFFLVSSAKKKLDLVCSLSILCNVSHMREIMYRSCTDRVQIIYGSFPRMRRVLRWR